MRIRIVLLLFLSVLLIFMYQQPVQEEGAATAGLDLSLAGPFQAGASCTPYEPKGQVVYKSEWTGEYPVIEQFDGSYRTATFGLG